MDTWRLSRIEDELERLDFTQDPGNPSLSDAIFSSLPLTLGFNPQGGKHGPEDDEGYSEDDNESLPPPPQDLPPPPDDMLYPEHPPPPPDIETMDAPVRQISLPSKDMTMPEGVPQMDIITPKGALNSSPSKKSLDSLHQSKETIYSEAVISREKQSITQSDVGVKQITDKYDSLQRLKLTPFSPIVPPGYVNTKSPDKKLSISGPIETDPPSASVLPPDIVHEDSLSEIRHSNSWLELQGQGRIPPMREIPLVDSLSNQGMRKPSFISSLSEQEILQVEMFYRSHKSEVFVCTCEADLLYGSVRDSNTFDNFYSSDSNTSGWTLVKAGIPALVLDTAERKLHLLLTERGTGFTLWRETVSHLTNYTAVQPHFHTLHLSSDHSKLIGLSFQDASCGSDFHQKLKSIISNPEDDILNIGKKIKKKKKDKKSVKVKKTNKADISAPCCFTHITALDRTDGMEVGGKDSAMS